MTFGNYEQDGDTENGPEPIEWIVLEALEDRMLLVSRYGLDARPYHAKSRDITWERCKLREWLNGEFLREAFGEAEQNAVLTTGVDNGAAQGYGEWDTDGGSDTQDRVFLLSYAEAWKYFADDAARQCRPTAYAAARGAGRDSENGNCWWWLRSPGGFQNVAAVVTVDGSCNYGGVYNGFGAVRPAVWVDAGSIF